MGGSVVTSSQIAVLGNSTGMQLFNALGGVVTVDNGLFAFNGGPALSVYLAELALDQVTFHGNAGGAVYLDEAGGTLSNSIVTGHEDIAVWVADAPTHPSLPSTFTLDHVLFDDNGTDSDDDGEGVIVASATSAGDPLYVDVSDDEDVENDDFGLDPSSPAVDAGTGTDPDGSAGDLGAYGGSGGAW